MPRAVLVRDPRYPIGGLETWTETLASLLPARGIEVTLLAPRSGDPAAGILEELQMRAAAGEHGVVFTGGYHYLNVAGINLIGAPWVPVPVLHGRDPGAMDWLAVGPPRKIVVPATDLAEDVRAALRTRVGSLRARNRVVVIPHGVRIPAEVRRREPSLPLNVLVLSRFEEEVKRASDYVRIVEAASHLPLRFTFAGDGSALPSMRERLGDRVRFTGPLPRDQVYEELQNADVLLSASESEAFGLSIAEALACGCHVIAADAGAAVREMLPGKVVRPGDIDAFVRELTRLTEHPAPAERPTALTSDEGMADTYAALVRSIRTRPNRNWQPAMYRTPSDALPRTVAARAKNWFRALREVLS